MAHRNFAVFAILSAFIIIGCVQKQAPSVVELQRFPLDSMEGLITRSGVEIDNQFTSEGKGSLRITATEPTTVRLFVVSGLNVDNARLIYQARIKTEGVTGQAFLEMWCHFPGKGEFFSRGLQNSLTGTADWTTEETTFFLKKGETPDYVKLNLVVNGAGKVWVDDVRLLKAPL
ncbi:MAG: hypothetical protein ACM3MB_02190 [Acidobacteriota bacterium]